MPVRGNEIQSDYATAWKRSPPAPAAIAAANGAGVPARHWSFYMLDGTNVTKIP